MKYIITITKMENLKGEAWVWMHNSLDPAMETAQRLTEVTGGDVYVSQIVARFHQETLCELNAGLDRPVTAGKKDGHGD